MASSGAGDTVDTNAGAAGKRTAVVDACDLDARDDLRDDLVALDDDLDALDDDLDALDDDLEALDESIEELFDSCDDDDLDDDDAFDACEVSKTSSMRCKGGRRMSTLCGLAKALNNSY